MSGPASSLQLRKSFTKVGREQISSRGGPLEEFYYGRAAVFDREKHQTPPDGQCRPGELGQRVQDENGPECDQHPQGTTQNPDPPQNAHVQAIVVTRGTVEGEGGVGIGLLLDGDTFHLVLRVNAFHNIAPADKR